MVKIVKIITEILNFKNLNIRKIRLEKNIDIILIQVKVLIYLNLLLSFLILVGKTLRII